ncbi:D-serine ammonia-lyase [Shewanella psychrophila]|uniref:Probable D-serine dehydratase n=1 Tax=Shewanella psychrophila TaxID=225848 RepID=A0A1S6HUT9_9GAMM|nr:D-serine ammonia-lyase [Shewanella psychrophila]AQS39249.1 D-serine ammonia-lyase [Shewanella psychrophila]
MNKLQVELLVNQFPLLADLISLKPLSWFNPEITSFEEALPYVGLTAADVKLASERLLRFASFIERVFPETQISAGIIESPLQAIPEMKAALSVRYQTQLPGDLMVKLDSQLPISGSIKARGGIHEVLHHAESLALEAGILKLDDDYAKLDSDEFRDFFGQYKIAVGSTGNLGLSIGIMSATLGLKVSVHMSADARQWKKDRLRSHGVKVVEYASDYSVAVERGREEALKDPYCHFVDDENSTSLFLGYAVAADRLKKQFDEQGVLVDEAHPLFVYLPCGVGGGPGGVAFGLKLAFGDHVHCIFAEPTHSPCMLMGVHTGLHDEISVQELGIDNITAADGLAVGRASGFVGKAMARMIDGYITITDDEMYGLLGLLYDSQSIKLEPSALAGMPGMVQVMRNRDYLSRIGLEDKLEDATHLVWATGGGMVPDDEMEAYLQRAKE